MKKKYVSRPIKSDVSALIEQLVRQGYTLDEAKKIAESRSPESVSSAADVLSAFGILGLSHLRKIASAIDDEVEEPKDFTDDAGGDAPPVEGEVAEGEVAEGEVAEGEVAEGDDFSEFALGDDVSDVDLTAALEAIATIADAVLVTTGNVAVPDPDYGAILDILGGLDDGTDAAAVEEEAPDVPAELANSLIQIHTAEDGIEFVSVADDDGLPVVTGVEPSEDDALLFEDAEPTDDEAAGVDEVVACLRRRGSRKITSRYVFLKSGWGKLDAVRSSVWRKASRMVASSGVKAGTASYFASVALLASALYNRFVVPSKALWSSLDKMSLVSKVARILLASSAYVDGGMDSMPIPESDVPFMGDKTAVLGTGSDTGADQPSSDTVKGGSASVQENDMETVFDFDTGRILDIDLPMEDGSSSLMQFEEVSSSVCVLRNPRQASRIASSASGKVYNVADGVGIYLVKSSVFGFVGFRVQVPAKVASSVTLASTKGGLVLKNGDGPCVASSLVRDLEAAYCSYLRAENRKLASRLRLLKSSSAAAPVRSSARSGDSRILRRRVDQLRSALAKRDATIERLQKVVQSGVVSSGASATRKRHVRSAVTAWAVVDNTANTRYRYYFDMFGDAYTLDGDYPRITEAQAKSLLKKLERKYPYGDWEVVPVDDDNYDDDIQQSAALSRRRAANSSVRHSVSSRGSSRIVSGYRKRLGALKSELAAVTSNKALVDEFKVSADDVSVQANQFKANVDFLSKLM